MKTINQTFKTEKNARANQPLCLFTLFDVNGAGENLTFTDNNEDTVFDGVTYHKAGIEFQQISENMQGEIDLIDIIVLNVGRGIQSYLEEYDIREKKIVVRIVWANRLSDPDAYLDFPFSIENYNSTDEDAHFICSTKMDLLERTLPADILMRNHCTYRIFKDPQTCGYAGPETSCNRTKQRCKELGNYRRFGGAPSIPSNTNYVL